jgi:Rps23 Pro-64 3,4-dihydroxylase Tpa1-like proline 4-hydroxylase
VTRQRVVCGLSMQDTNDVAEEPHAPLRQALFEQPAREAFKQDYDSSVPYHHLVIADLMDDKLLQATRDELQHNVQATLKETDIYKVKVAESRCVHVLVILTIEVPAYTLSFACYCSH